MEPSVVYLDNVPNVMDICIFLKKEKEEMRKFAKPAVFIVTINLIGMKG